MAPDDGAGVLEFDVALPEDCCSSGLADMVKVVMDGSSERVKSVDSWR